MGQLVWIIPVSIVGGILVLGVLLLVMVKIILASKQSSGKNTDLRYICKYHNNMYASLPMLFLVVSR